MRTETPSPRPSTPTPPSTDLPALDLPLQLPVRLVEVEVERVAPQRARILGQGGGGVPELARDLRPGQVPLRLGRPAWILGQQRLAPRRDDGRRGARGDAMRDALEVATPRVEHQPLPR